MLVVNKYICNICFNDTISLGLLKLRVYFTQLRYTVVIEDTYLSIRAI